MCFGNTCSCLHAIQTISLTNTVIFPHKILSGKSTFLKMLYGQQAPDAGVITPGETIVFGVYDQMGMALDDEQRVMDFVKQRVMARDGSTMAEAPGEVMKLLARFQFPKERWNERILRLSGGERRRLQLLSVLTQRPNFLILDEPVSNFLLPKCDMRVFLLVSHSIDFIDLPFYL